MRKVAGKSAGAGDHEVRQPDFLEMLKRHWRVPLILLILAFFVIPVWLLVDNYTDSSGVEELPNGTSLGAPRYNYFGNAIEVYSPPESGYPNDLCVTFEFLGLNEATSQANFGILIEATKTGDQQLESQLQALAHPPKRGTLEISSTSGISNISIPFSISTLENTRAVTCSSPSPNPVDLDLDAGIRITQSIFTLGTPRAFPNDWYELDDAVNISIPGTTLYSSLIMTSRDEDFSLSVSVYKPSKTSNAGPDILEFTIRRPWLVRWYTYTVAAMPFVLLIGVFLIKYWRSGNVQDGDPDQIPQPWEVAFGVAATLVAILPLRSVLVPSSLPSPTRLDIDFGLGTIFLVVFSIIWILVRTAKISAARGQAGEPSPGSSSLRSGKGAATPPLAQSHADGDGH